jgi:hypothetical protein
MEYSTYRVLCKGAKTMEMEYSILTLTAREIFFKIPLIMEQKVCHTMLWDKKVRSHTLDHV